MEDNFSGILQEVLGNPEAMQKLMGVAEKLMAGSEKSETATVQEKDKSSDSEEKLNQEVKQASLAKTEKKPGNEERIALILALRPYLSSERRHTADSLVKMLKMLKLADINKLLK